MSYKNYKSVFVDKTIMLNLIKKFKKKIPYIIVFCIYYNSIIFISKLI